MPGKGSGADEYSLPIMDISWCSTREGAITLPLATAVSAAQTANMLVARLLYVFSVTSVYVRCRQKCIGPEVCVPVSCEPY